MFSALEQNMMQDALAKVTLWCIGEFGHLLVNGEVQIERQAIISSMNSLLEQKCNKGVKSYILNCCIKLFARFNGDTQGIQEIFTKLASDSDVDIQQRAFEYGNIAKSTRLSFEQKKSLFEEIPVSRISANVFNSKPVDIGGEIKNAPQAERVTLSMKGATGVVASSSNNDGLLDLLDEPGMTPNASKNESQPAQPTQPASNNMNLMDLDLMGGESTTPATNTINNAEPRKKSNNLLDLDFGDAPAQTVPTSQPQGQTGFNMDLMNLDATPTQSAPAASNDFGMLDLGGVSTAPQPAQSAASGINLAAQTPTIPATSSQGGFDALDLLGGAQTSTQSQNSVTNSQPSQISAPVTGGDDFEFDDFTPASNSTTYSAFKDDTLEIKFICKKDSDPKKTLIDVAIDNNSLSDISQIDFKVGAAKHLSLESFNPLGTSSIQSGQKGVTTHKIEVVNSLQGQKAIAFKLQLQYTANGTPVTREAVLSSMPANY